MKYVTLHTKGRLKTSKASFAKTRYSDFSKPNQAGMTLIEVLVAMFVLAIGVLALLAIQKGLLFFCQFHALFSSQIFIATSQARQITVRRLPTPAQSPT